MRKNSLLLLLFCLTMATAFAFATKPKFAGQGLVIDNGGGSYSQLSLTGSLAGTDLQTTPIGSGLQMKVNNQSGTQKNVFLYDGVSTYTPVYSNGTW